MHLVLVGTSHRLAPVELREKLAFDLAEAGGVAKRLAGDGGEAVALSTCNRVCFYLAHADADTARRRAVRELEALAGADDGGLEGLLYVRQDEEAARHLFRVASGLDSLVPGEAQILGQVRSACEQAEAAGAVGLLLRRLFRDAVHVGRRVRRETGLGENPASVSAAAAELATRIFDDLPQRRVLLIGAGKMGELAARNLVSRGVSSLVVANRSAERASGVVAKLGGRSIGLDGLAEALVDADVVISSTGTQGFVVDADVVKEALGKRKGTPIFFVDIAVPRDIDPSINELPGCYVYDIDDLERVVEESLAARRGEASRAEELVAGTTQEFRSWQLSLEVVPAIADLRRRGEEIRDGELERMRAVLAGLSPRERVAVEALAAGIVNKLLHRPTVRLKEAAANADGAAYADTVRDIFGLPREPRS